MSIDWSKAPEGFPIWLEDIRPSRRSGDSEDRSSWAKDGEGEYTLFGVTSGWWAKSREGHDFIAHQKPAQWTGDGLPPVGTVVELCNVKTVLADDFDYDQHCIVDTWRNGDRLEVIARRNVHGTEGVIVFNANRMQASAIMSEFYKPAKTPEQIAAEECSAAIKEMVSLCPYPGSDCTLIDCTALYEAGYRKQVPQ